MTDMKRNKLVFALVTITRNILKSSIKMLYELLLFSVSSWQPLDPHWPEAGEHLVCEHGLVQRVLPRQQAQRPAHARHQGQAHRLRVGDLWLGAPQLRGQHPTLPTPGGDTRARMGPALRRLEHRMHPLWTLSGQLFKCFMSVWPFKTYFICRKSSFMATKTLFAVPDSL